MATRCRDHGNPSAALDTVRGNVRLNETSAVGTKLVDRRRRYGNLHFGLEVDLQPALRRLPGKPLPPCHTTHGFRGGCGRADGFAEPILELLYALHCLNRQRQRRAQRSGNTLMSPAGRLSPSVKLSMRQVGAANSDRDDGEFRAEHGHACTPKWVRPLQKLYAQSEIQKGNPKWERPSHIGILRSTAVRVRLRTTAIDIP